VGVQVELEGLFGGQVTVAVTALELGDFLVSNSIDLTGFNLLLGMLRLTVVPNCFHQTKLPSTNQADPVVVVSHVGVSVVLVQKVSAADFAVVGFVLEVHLDVIDESMALAQFLAAEVAGHVGSVDGRQVLLPLILRFENFWTLWAGEGGFFLWHVGEQMKFEKSFCEAHFAAVSAQIGEIWSVMSDVTLESFHIGTLNLAHSALQVVEVGVFLRHVQCGLAEKGKLFIAVEALFTVAVNQNIFIGTGLCVLVKKVCKLSIKN